MLFVSRDKPFLAFGQLPNGENRDFQLSDPRSRLEHWCAVERISLCGLEASGPTFFPTDKRHEPLAGRYE